MTYMENPQDANKEEKCIYSNHRGFLNDDQKSRIAEMIALSEEPLAKLKWLNDFTYLHLSIYVI